MEQKARTPLQVMRSSLTALVIRDIQRRFIISANTRRSIGFLWIFIEPLLHVAVWSAVRLFYGISTPGLVTPVFVILGVLPFLLLQRMISSSGGAIVANKNIFLFRQIKPIDCIIAIWFTQSVILVAIGILLFCMFRLFNIPFQLYQPILACTYVFLHIFFVLGISIALAVIGYFSTFFNKITVIFQRGLYFISGIFFPADSIPPSVRPYFLLNPLFQTIEGLRECFNHMPVHGHYADPVYMFKCTIVCLFLGLLLYIRKRETIMKRIQEK